ncbi:MAG TPA: class I SAM-dependent methyltransferase [Anaerolineae bacterium]|nr:class I SAM-dependent methyltransferase [Anaerolineae bacterium]
MAKSITSAYYDDYWSRHTGWTPHPSLTTLKRKLFTRFVTPHTVVLDVGCGNGVHYGRDLASIAPEYYGLDISEVAVETAQRNGIRAQSHNLQVPFPFPAGKFDTILCVEVLEHLFDPAFALSEMRRVLKGGGHIIVSVPNIAHLSNRVRAVLGGFSPGGTPETSSRRQWADPHIRFFTLRSLRGLAAEQRMNLVEVYGEGFSVFSTFPVFSPLAARLVGWERLERWSQPFEFLARWWPSLMAGHLIGVIKYMG